jgi:site-specific DNA recombinase
MTDRAVLYARVSSDDRGKDGRNLAGQLRMCREYAQKHGWTVVAALAEDDRGASGASLGLPQLDRALSMARDGLFDTLVTRELDRFARSLAKQLVVETEFQRAGVRIVYVLG